MIGDGEAVGLLLDAPDEGKHRRNCLDADLGSLRRHQGAGAVAVVFDHAENRQLDTHQGQSLLYRLGMDHTAVDQQGIRLFLKALVPVEIAAKPPAQHLPHGGVVILILHVFQLKAFVVALFRLSIDEDRHGSHNVRSGNVGNVVCLQTPRILRQTQHSLQHGQGTAEAFCGCGGALCLLLGVLTGQVRQTLVVATIRHGNADFDLQLLLQKLGKQLGILHGKGQQNPSGRGLS